MPWCSPLSIYIAHSWSHRFAYTLRYVALRYYSKLLLVSLFCACLITEADSEKTLVTAPHKTALDRPHNEMNLKRNSFETVFRCADSFMTKTCDREKKNWNLYSHAKDTIIGVPRILQWRGSHGVDPEFSKWVRTRESGDKSSRNWSKIWNYCTIFNVFPWKIWDLMSIGAERGQYFCATIRFKNRKIQWGFELPNPLWVYVSEHNF